jgi:hypothetical protein
MLLAPAPQKFNTFNTITIFKSAPDIRRCFTIRRGARSVATRLPDAMFPLSRPDGRGGLGVRARGAAGWGHSAAILMALNYMD